jgi:hypothetical protein
MVRGVFVLRLGAAIGGFQLSARYRLAAVFGFRLSARYRLAAVFGFRLSVAIGCGYRLRLPAS